MAGGFLCVVFYSIMIYITAYITAAAERTALFASTFNNRVCLLQILFGNISLCINIAFSGD